MCGIFGFYRKKEGPGLALSAVKPLADLMKHRGPDDEGYYVDGRVALGHRRLSIIDLSGGRQPIETADGAFSIIFNGEIYNYREISSRLKEKGYIFKTQSDTEVILNAYREYGVACLNQFRGIFAFAIYDKIHESLFVARDQMGVKPLYYFEDADLFLFASEVKPLLRSGFLKPRVNPQMVDFYFTLGFTPAPETLFEGIRKLPPAHYMEVTPSSTRISEYWRLEEVEEAPVSFEAARKTLQDLLMGAVESQLMSEVPLGAFLSGGLDSSAVVSCMRRLGCKDLKTFSIGYRNAEKESELRFARRVAELFETDHHEFYLEHADFLETLDSMLDFTEEPLVDSSAIALFQLSKQTKPYATVLLSGEGGDELFAGYPLYPRMDSVRRLGMALVCLPGASIEWISCLPYVPEKAVKYLDWATDAARHRYSSIATTVTRGIRGRMYSDVYQRELNDMEGPEAYFSQLMNKVTHRGRLFSMQYIDTKTWLVDDLMLKADKMSMAASIELRVPLLDTHLVQFAASLPDSYKLNGGTGKFIFKKAMEGFLPKEIIYRPKQGFPVPIRQWFRTSLYEKVRKIFLSSESALRPYIRTEYIERILSQHQSGWADHSTRILSFLIFEFWSRKYIGHNKE